MINRDKFYFRIFCCTFWIVAVGKFVAEQLIPFIGDISTPLMLLGDVMLFGLALCTTRQKQDITLIVVFLAFAIFSSWYNGIPTLLMINGLRDYLPFICFVPIIRYFFMSRYSDEFRQSFDRQLRTFLIVQAVCITEQYLRYGAGDQVGGSLGNGSSGLISFCIITASFYLVSRNWDSANYLKSLWSNRWYIFLLFPVFLNETKISFILLFIYFLLLYRFDTKGIGKFILATPLIILAVVGLVYAYIKVTGLDEVTSSDFLEWYLTGGDEAEHIQEVAEMALDFAEDAEDTWEDSGWAFIDIPRFLKLKMVPEAVERTRGGLLFGAGMGHFKGGSVFARTSFANENYALFFGTNPLIMLFFIPFGIVGLVWLAVWYIHVLAFRQRFGPMAIQIKFFILSVFIIQLFYQEIMRFFVPCAIIYYILLTTCYPLKKTDEPESVNNSTGL